MPANFFTRLNDYFNNIGASIRGEANAAAIFPNSTDKGTSRERLYEDVLRLHLPATCMVSLGGFIFDHNGNESQQIDIFVHSDRALRFNFHNPDGKGKSFCSIEGCLAVVAVKSMLDKEKLIECLNNLASVPESPTIPDNRLSTGVKLPGGCIEPEKIIFALDGIGPEKCEEILIDYYNNINPLPYMHWPNLIHVCGKYGIGKIPSGSACDTNSFGYFTTNPDCRAFLKAIIEIQRAAIAAGEILYDYARILERIDEISDE